jgi:hypothetical protein
LERAEFPVWVTKAEVLAPVMSALARTADVVQHDDKLEKCRYLLPYKKTSNFRVALDRIASRKIITTEGHIAIVAWARQRQASHVMARRVERSVC